VADLPLLRRFPALASLPRVSLGRFPTPVQRVTRDDGRILLLKRDDLSGDVIGGNKVRGLEWLLAGVRSGDEVLTVGARGSTHALSTALLAAQLGAQATVVRWNQEMNPAARVVDERLRAAARVVDARFVTAAYLVAGAIRLRRRVRWVPAGGASPVAVLGHMNAALELAAQIEESDAELPEEVYVPLGTGGTAAGLALGFCVAKLGIRVVAVRVVPGIVARRSRVLGLASRAAALVERVTGESVPRVPHPALVIEHGFYGGAYGRPLPGIPYEEELLLRNRLRLDDTYSRKAFAAALRSRAQRAMLWVTFDGRLLQD
jgi:1-aminocyclopropane-1-carboxylate deaminase/D-cysteine desulfhydrase-like pyridoxal-dependent ACC family enzyme